MATAMAFAVFLHFYINHDWTGIMLKTFRRARVLCLFALLAVAACGGGGSSSPGGVDDGGGSDGGDKTYVCDGTGSVSVSGRIHYEFVPTASNNLGSYLDYGNTQARPVRRAAVLARCPDGSRTYATTTTDDAGNYSLTVPSDVDLVIRARALLVQSGAPGWDLRVVDNTNGQAVWSVEGEAIDRSTVTGSVTVNLLATSGWGGSSYTGARAAAPFAILDSAYTAMRRVLEADPAAVFEPLKMNWHPTNRASCSRSLADYPFPDGCIGTSFFVNLRDNGGRNIFILGDEDVDTDEYDSHVVIHEWGHYYEDAFSRSDSIGGRHGAADKLDMRVAFGEGWGNAWSGIATDDPLYVDTYGSSQQNGFSINVESDSTVSPGWWNETSVQRIIYDLYDAANDDGVALGFGPIHAVLTNEQRAAAAMASIFPLVYFIKENNIGSAGDIDALVERNDIAPINDQWGDNRQAGMLLGGDGDDGSEFGFSAESEKYITPVHKDVGTVSHGTSAEICSTNKLAGESPNYTEYNRLGARRFVRFQVGTGATWRITLDGSSTGIPGSDPDFFVYLDGDRIAVANADSSSTNKETQSIPLSAGTTYVLEALEYLNTDNDSSTGGNACMSLSFELI